MDNLYQNEFDRFCEEHGIRRQLYGPRTPQQNIFNKRNNTFVVEIDRTML